MEAVVRVGTAAIVLLAITGLFIAATPAEAAPAPGATAIHRVAAGDTLWNISRRYGTTPERLAAVNGIRVTATLKIGQPLRLPAPREAALASMRAADRPSVQAYRIQQGDTLWSIARRYGTRPERIAAANGISTEATLRIGRTLTIPVGANVPAAPAIRGEEEDARVAARTRATADAAMRARLAALPSRGEKWFAGLVALSSRYLGVRYRWGGTSPAGFDCSGFLYYVFGKMGVALPRTTFDMYAAGAAVPRDGLEVGDILFFETVSPGPSHAGIYLGDGRFIHASSGAGRVLITSMDHAYYAVRFLGARRF